MGTAGGVNLYAYTANPLTVVDLDGLSTGKAHGGASDKKGKGKGKPNQQQAKKIRELTKKARAAKGKKADDIRYKRYKYAFGINPKNKGKKPLSRKDWNKKKATADQNRQRGGRKQDLGRKGVEKHLGGKLEDNNRGKVKTFTDAETGETTRPDSLGRDKDGNRVVHDHKHFSKGDQVQNCDKQMQAQQKMAGKNGKHVVSMSSSQPSLKGDPPKPRPSKPLAKDSDVYYTDKDGNVTHKWGENEANGTTGWQDV